ncbi:hypothetical protein L603_002800000490 [Cellulosimicrobium cellulans J34]|uniref:hypothetical protein n=1 Tax=Cellulosimicrobium sp. SH8 TaxID=2952936 RepID=UPI000464AF8E|nr:hypothetical protein [Cellulosimicrobium sp. SH8]TWG82816.1 hypothetical protein L603_002800000490 [Cellulosimicrobium cellulans J34]SMF13381.1 hypothetical protein SAMN02744115_01611 [Cellulosimicrobium cellulans J1]
MPTTALDPLEVARATLRRAELRTGVRSSTPGVFDLDDAPRPLGAILDGGRLPRGAASVVTGSTSLLLALLAMSQGSSDWLAVVGAPDLGMLAAADAGVALDRVALVPRAGDDPAGVVAALLDGMTYVVIGPDAWLTAPEHRRLLARARERGSGLVAVSPWEHAAVRLDVVTHRWGGTDAGDGYLRRCELDVARTARGTTDRWTLTLPTPGSLLVDPLEGQARPAAQVRRAPLRLVG